MKKEVITLRKDIAGDGNVYSFAERVKADGQIEELRIRFYPGLERELQIRPYVLHKGSKAEDFFSYVEGTELFLTGDDDYFVYPLNIQVEYDDQIVIECKNVNINEYTYTAVLDIVISYMMEI